MAVPSSAPLSQAAGAPPAVSTTGPRIDLIGCRALEVPQEGAELLKTLSALVSVPFAASDDALGGYLLVKAQEQGSSGTSGSSLTSTSILGLDLYFDRNSLIKIS